MIAWSRWWSWNSATFAGVSLRGASVLLDERADLLKAGYETVLARDRRSPYGEREQTELVGIDDLPQPVRVTAHSPASRLSEIS